MAQSYAPQKPKVTIIIPTYGQEHTILQALDSALAQDYPSLEVLVADDASPDLTQEIVATRQDPRLRYHRNDINLGRVANYRHALYSLATGDWVVNLDGDDFFTDPGFIESAIELTLSDTEILMVSARCRVDSSESSYISDSPGNCIIHGRQVVLKLHVMKEYSFYHMCILYQRQMAMSCDFYRQDIISSDQESLYRLAILGKVAYLDRVIGVWVKHGNNASSSTCISELIKNLNRWNNVYNNCRNPETNQIMVNAIRFKMQLKDAYLYFMTILKKDGAFKTLEYLTQLMKYNFILFLLTITIVLGITIMHPLRIYHSFKSCSI